MTLIRFLILATLTIIVLLVTTVVVALHGHTTGWMITKRPTTEWFDRLEPHLTIVRPDRPGPHPVMLIISGCGGVRETHQDWADFAARDGYLAVIVDSMAARGLSREQSLAQVCSARRLWGRERAGDVASVIAHLDRIADADPARVVLFGQSHGAWSIMDLLAMDFSVKGPTNLWPVPSPAVQQRVIGAILLYPYCGFFSLSDDKDWMVRPPTYMALAGNDTVVSPLACRKVAERMAGNGLTIELRYFDDAGHAFDETGLPADSPFEYREDLTLQVKADLRRFLQARNP